MATFDLMELESANLMATYSSRCEALEAVRRMVGDHGPGAGGARRTLGGTRRG